MGGHQQQQQAGRQALAGRQASRLAGRQAPALVGLVGGVGVGVATHERRHLVEAVGLVGLEHVHAAAGCMRWQSAVGCGGSWSGWAAAGHGSSRAAAGACRAAVDESSVLQLSSKTSSRLYLTRTSLGPPSSYYSRGGGRGVQPGTRQPLGQPAVQPHIPTCLTLLSASPFFMLSSCKDIQASLR